jgi:hypothetical protein
LFSAFFWAFRNKGSSKTRNKIIFIIKKIHLGSSQKMWLFFVPQLFLPQLFLVWFDFVLSRIAVLGTFRNKGEFKNAIKENRAKIPAAP